MLLKHAFRLRVSMRLYESANHQGSGSAMVRAIRSRAVHLFDLPDSALRSLYDVCGAFDKAMLQCTSKRFREISAGCQWGDIVLDLSMPCFLGSGQKGPSRSLLKLLTQHASRLSSVTFYWSGYNLEKDPLLWFSR
jgi:hypothetical protein